jgi:hypothetical protein
VVSNSKLVSASCFTTPFGPSPVPRRRHSLGPAAVPCAPVSFNWTCRCPGNRLHASSELGRNHYKERRNRSGLVARAVPLQNDDTQ